MVSMSHQPIKFQAAQEHSNETHLPKDIYYVPKPNISQRSFTCCVKSSNKIYSLFIFLQ